MIIKQPRLWNAELAQRRRRSRPAKRGNAGDTFRVIITSRASPAECQATFRYGRLRDEMLANVQYIMVPSRLNE